MNHEYSVGTRCQMKKKHPCGGDIWEVLRVGADIKIKCQTCGRTFFIPRIDFNKKIKKTIKVKPKLISVCTFLEKRNKYLGTLTLENIPALPINDDIP